MKKVKRILAMIMAMAMVLGMSMTTFAADEAETTDATVKVTNKGAEALKYIQIVEADRTSEKGWKLSDDYATIITGAGCTLDDILSATGGSAATGTMTSSEKLSAALEALRESETVTGWTTIDGNSFNVTKGGLYLIIPEQTGYTYAPTLAYVGVGKTGEVAVQAKGAPDKITKAINEDGQSVAPGDTVHYTVTVAYPYIPANYKDATFVITDTITNGTLKDGDITVTGMGTADDYTVSAAAGDSSFTVSVKNYKSDLAGKTITIEYDVVVGDVTSENLLKNKVSSVLDLDGDGEPDGGSEHEVTSATVKVEITKIGDGNEKNLLPGAKFQLYVADENGTETLELQNGSVKANKVGDPMATDKNGKLTFDSLDAQKVYYVMETEAPHGYKVDETAYKLENNTTTEDSENNNANKTIYVANDFAGLTVDNTSLSALPSTGGIGTTIFTIGGCVIMIAAAAMFFANRKKEQE